MKKRGHPIVPSRRHLPQGQWVPCIECKKPCVFPSPCGRCQFCYSQHVQDREQARFLQELQERDQ